MMTWYKGNGTDNPGFISRSWWTGAALFLACLNYWHATNDTTYNEDVSIGMQHQGSPTGDYMPSWASGIVSVPFQGLKSHHADLFPREMTIKCSGASQRSQQRNINSRIDQPVTPGSRLQKVFSMTRKTQMEKGGIRLFVEVVFVGRRNSGKVDIP